MSALDQQTVFQAMKELPVHRFKVTWQSIVWHDDIETQESTEIFALPGLRAAGADCLESHFDLVPLASFVDTAPKEHRASRGCRDTAPTESEARGDILARYPWLAGYGVMPSSEVDPARARRDAGAAAAAEPEDSPAAPMRRKQG